MSFAATAAVLAALATAPAADTHWWVFLNKGPKRDQAKEWLEQGQKAHLGNLDRLAGEGKVPLAGPLLDDGFIRGIVVVKAKDQAELMESFGPDPFVQEGRLAVEAYPWDADVARLGKASPPYKMIDASTVIMKKGPKWSAEGLQKVKAAHHAYLAELQAKGELAIFGGLKDAGDKLAVLMFHSAEAAHVQELLARDPAVAAGIALPEIHPQYLADGVLPRPKP